MRWIMAGGGTGGHLFPGLAVARELQRRQSMAEILFVGTERGIESRIVPREGFSLETLPIKGIKGRGIQGLLEAGYGVPVSVAQGLKIIGRFQPDGVLGLGGYASAPLVLAAKIKRLPCAILEQNVRPGLSNRLLGRFVDKIFTSYDESILYFPRSKVVHTGNPVRWQRIREIKRDRFTLLVVGGSGGAHKINVAVVDALGQLKDHTSDLRVIHQTGDADLRRVQEAYLSLPFENEVSSFIDKMDDAYAQADLLVCRAGATTVAELTVLGKPAILVPYPYAADDHQRLNAEALWKKGAADLILDQDLTGETLAARIRSFLENPQRCELMAESAKRLGKPEATRRIADECVALVQGD